MKGICRKIPRPKMLAQILFRNLCVSRLIKIFFVFLNKTFVSNEIISYNSYVCRGKPFKNIGHTETVFLLRNNEKLGLLNKQVWNTFRRGYLNKIFYLRGWVNKLVAF